MNIGILTFHNADNYGSVLQAYALKSYVEGIEGVSKCEIVNYIPPNQEDLYAIYLPFNSVKNIIKNIRSFWFRRLLKDRKSTFKQFRINRLHVNDKMGRFTSEKEVNLVQFDTMIVGSDQIWNPRSIDFSMQYYLPDFKGKKIAYAPSFGNGEVKDFSDKNVQIEVGDALRDFDAISVREETGISIVEKLSGEKAITVVDPTLLLKDKWNDIASKCGEGEEYIFFYAIDYNHEAIEMVQKISQKTGLPVKVIFSTNKTYRVLGKGFELVKDTAPEDFLGLVKNAKIVLSSSFHGTAFGVIFHKNIFALEAHRNGAIYKDQRIHNLLSKLKLENRIIRMDDIDKTDFLENISFDDKLFDEVVYSSEKFLLDAIKD